jgi:hypothetical protein
LRAQVAEAVRARRIRKVKTRTNQKYTRKCPENSSITFWSRREDPSLEPPLPLPGLQSAVSAEESDEQKANLKQAKVTGYGY